MGEIQAFREEHLPEVASLFMRRMHGKPVQGPVALQNHFRDIFLTNPWATPDIYSRVYFNKGQVAGFLGVVPRHMEFEGKPIRVAATGQMMADRGPAALEMLANLFKGPQDLVFGDGASELAHRVFVGVGGYAANLYSFNWLRPLRVVQTVRNYLDRAGGMVRLAGGAVALAAVPIEFLMSKLPVEALRKPQSPLTTQWVDVDKLFEAIQKIGWRERLKPVYEQASFRWLIAEMRNSPAEFLMATLSNPDGVMVGWYVMAVEKSGGPAHLFQLGVQKENLFDDAFRAVLRDAWNKGASSLKGGGMPQYLTSLTTQYCLFRHANTCVNFHTRDAKLRETIYSGKAALSRLEGESWMHFTDRHWA